MNTGGSTSNAGTSNAGSSSGAAATSGRQPAQPFTPHADLSTYIAKTLRGSGKKELETEIPAGRQDTFKTTPEKIADFDKIVNEYVKEEVEQERDMAKNNGPEHSHTTPELAYTDKVMKLSNKHKIAFMAPCKNERETGGDIICGLHVEHVTPAKTTKIFAVVQMKVAETFVKASPVIDFTHKNPNGLQLELLAKEVQRRRAEFAPDVDVIGAYGVIYEDRLVFLPIDDILEHFKGKEVNMTADFKRAATTALIGKYGHTGFLAGMLAYVDKHAGSTPPGTPSSKMDIDSGKKSPNHSH
ncbi:hypothetical protein FRC17_000690 [Serendipita sp. 399]|nr:hypothetical protein FRC17_000690 [Serendipita sp. 399]